MKANHIVAAILIIVSGAFYLSLITLCGWQSQAGRAAGMESQGFDVLAHRVFGESARVQAEQSGDLQVGPKR